MNSGVTNFGRLWMNSRIFAFRQASSSSSWVTSETGFTVPRRILKRIDPAYNV